MSKKVGQMNNERCEAAAKLDEIKRLEVSKQVTLFAAYFLITVNSSRMPVSNVVALMEQNQTTNKKQPDLE